MKERLRNEILLGMQQYVSSDVLTILDSVVVKALFKVEVVHLETLPSTETDNNEYIIKLFIAKKGSKLSKKTMKFYLGSIKNLLTVVDKNLIKITDMDIDFYLQKYSERGNSSVTVNNERRNISAFYTWMRKSRLILENPVDNVEVRKEIQKPIDHLEGFEFEELRESCKDDRDRALLEFLRSTGVRVGEVPLINKEDINWNNGDITIFGEKTGKYRQVFLDDVAKFHLKKYVDERNDNNESLFVSVKKPYTTLRAEGIRSIIKNIATRSHMKRRVYPHLMRKTLATNLNQRNCPLSMIQQILGHSSPAVTMKHYAATSTEQLRHAHNQFVA